MRTQLWTSFSVLVLAQGCATVLACDEVQQQPLQITERLKDLPIYGPYRNQLKNKTFGTRLDYHQLVVSPRELIDGAAKGSFDSTMDLPNPIYFIGIEKVRKSAKPHVDKSCQGHGLDVARIGASIGNTPGEATGKKAEEAACQVLDDEKPLLLTHIARSDGLVDGRYLLPCLLYSIYPEGKRCEQAAPAANQGEIPYNYQAATEAIVDLRLTIEQAVETSRPTHLLVMSTGWNTQQDESLYNYVDWLNNIGKAADKEPFRPLVVAFTWQSGFDWLPRGSGVVTKGNDADEIGLTWANRVVNDVVMPVALKTGVPVAMIGHSYGTRVLGTAIFDRMALEHDTDVVGSGQVPIAFIAMQPALPVQRFTRAGKEPLYANWKSAPILMALTTSPHDQANSMLDRWWGIYAGGGKAISTVQEIPELDDFKTASVDDKGELRESLGGQGNYFVEASEIIRCNMPNTGGGAHSDVYDKEAGQMMWGIIRAISEEQVGE